MSNAHDIERSHQQISHMTLQDLVPAEQFVLGACRCWDSFMAHGDPSIAWRHLAPAFEFMNVLDALCAFDRTFTLLRADRFGKLYFKDADCSRIGTDEATLLAVIASLQRAQPRASLDLLRGPLTPRGLVALLPPLARIAAILDLRGHRLPRWTGLPLRSPSKPVDALRPDTHRPRPSTGVQANAGVALAG